MKHPLSMKKIAFPLIIAFGIFLLLPSPRAGGDNRLSFDVLSFRTPGIVILAQAGDVDGNTENDLLLFDKPSKESYEKFCLVYFQRHGMIESKPTLEIPLGKNISGIAIDDLNGDGKDDIIGFDGEGVILLNFHNAHNVSTTRIIVSPSLLPPTTRHLTAVNWIADLTNDGRKDVLVPLVNGMALFAQSDEMGFIRTATFDFPMNGSFRGQGDQQTIGYRLPTVDFSDYNGDGVTDLGTFDLERMDFFLSDRSHSLRSHKTGHILRKFTKDLIGSSNFGDLNDDGVPDAVLLLMSQKKNLESEVQIYYGDKNFSYGKGPGQIYSGHSSLLFPVFFDVDGDGKLEMMLQDVNVGIGFFMNYFLRNRIGVNMELRKIGSDGRYEQKPVLRRALYIQASESGSEPARAVGDFNSDGLDDFVVGASENKLSFFLANKKEILPREPSAVYDVPAYGDMGLLELSSDNRADFVILYTEEDKENLAVVFRSK